MDHTKTEHMLHHHRRGTMLRGIYPRRQAEGRSEVADCAMTARAALAVYSRSPQLAWRQAAERELDYALTHLCRRGGAFSAREDATQRTVPYFCASTIAPCAKLPLSM